jgi:hypothetical protein
MDFWTLYLLTIIPSVQDFATFMAFFSFVGFGFASILKYTDMVMDENILPRLNRVTKWCLPILFISATISLLLPNATGLATLVGGYYVTNIEGIADVSPNVVEMLNRMIEESGHDAQ